MDQSTADADKAEKLISLARAGKYEPRKYVVVEEEGGQFKFPTAELWKKSRAPIIGLWDGDWLYLWDSIIKAYRVRTFNEIDYAYAKWPNYKKVT